MRAWRVASVAILASVLVAALATSAAATQWRFNDLRLTADFQPFTVTTPLGRVQCRVVLSGTLPSQTIPKTAGVLLGEITAISIELCAGGTLSALRLTLPWHVYYQSFTGLLPFDITGIKATLVGVSLQATVLGTTCLARTTTTAPARATFNVNLGEIPTVELDPTSAIPLTGSFVCGSAAATVRGRGDVEGDPVLLFSVLLIDP